MKKIEKIDLNPFDETMKNFKVECTYNWFSPGLFEAKFIVTNKNGLPWNISKSFDDNGIENWGLWEHDVVEMFLQPRNDPSEITAPYLELQLSPRGQKFAVIVHDPRKKYETPFDLNFMGHSKRSSKEWSAEFKVTHELLLKPFLYGTFNACLGDVSCREFFASSWANRKILDFHVPNAFIQLNAGPKKGDDDC